MTFSSINRSKQINKLIQTTYDLIVIGGGITGAFAAWDAALRGLDVVLVYISANLICLLAATYPAWQASKMLPAESIRYE